MLPGHPAIDANRRAAPVIGITGGRATTGSVARVRTNLAYVRAVEAAGAMSVVVPPFEHGDAARWAAALAGRLDGLVLSGGEDVDPSLYGATPHPATEPPDALRDAGEIALVHAARERRLPLLAICRGLQVVNVAFGGTLVQDIASECRGALPHTVREPRHARSHVVAVTPGSRLAAALGGTTLPVNSMHHQAAGVVAPALRVVGVTADGLAEGLEHADAGWWMIAVQWHPEELTGTEEPWDRALFEAFVREAGQARAAAER